MPIRRIAGPVAILAIIAVGFAGRGSDPAAALVLSGNPQGEEIARPPPRRGEVNLGTGAVVSLNGDIITNQHVVNGCAKLAILDNAGDEFPAQVVLNDRRGRDLALVRPSTTTAADSTLWGHFALPLQGSAVKPGDPVRIAAYSYLQGKPFKLTFSSGSVVVATGQTGFALAFHATLSEGNSGGPVIDSRGRLSGLVVGRIVGSGDIGVGFTADEIADFLSAGGVNFERISWVSALPPSIIERIAQQATVGIQCTY